MDKVEMPQPAPLQRLAQAAAFRDFEDRLDYGLKLISPMNSAWAEGNYGQAAKIAVLDSGVVGHPDLAGGIVKRQDFTGDGVRDRKGHGTGVAGVIGARLNDKGTVGVAPRCEIYAGKVLGDDGRGSMTALAQGVEWAIQEGVDIINMSLGGPKASPQVRKAISEAHNAGITIIAASGNAGNEDPSKMDYPAAYPEVISVGAIEKGKRHASYSNAGAEIVGPGSQRYMLKPPDRYTRASGTSFASPSIAGVTALLITHERSEGRKPTPSSIRDALHNTAHDILGPGRDDLTGYGYVSVPRLLEE